METVNNLTSAASRAIWGESIKTTESEEPRSGETGDVSAGEPYDMGNEEPRSTSSTTDPTTSMTDPNTSSTVSKSDLPGRLTFTIPNRNEHETDKRGADKPTTDPSSDEHPQMKETKKEAEDAVNVNTIGTGSEPLIEKTAGTADEGTGEKIVESSGMKADGGDFGAANPGVGKEADRLLETKGIHQEPGSTDTSSKVGSKEHEDVNDSGSPSGGKLKGLKEKIKAKLHKK